jgi:hypothetical protein
MKKWVLIVVTMLLVVFAFSALTASAGRPDPAGTIRCITNIAYDGNYWSGTVEGCELEGTVEYHAVIEEYFFPGNTMHFVETFIFHPASGGELYGKDYGVWNMSTLKFRANGWINDATEEWSDFVGYHFQEMGTTTSPDALPVVADDTQVKIAPAIGRR